MSELIRLVYASRSTFARSAQHQGLDPGVARILAKSRKNNARRQIVGGLLFGDGCFLQCLEGEAQAVDTLYEKIAADPRHRDVKVLMRRKINERSFGAWSMKYVPGEQALVESLRAWGTARFDPYGLSDAQITAAVELMRRQADAAATLPSEFGEAAEALPNPGKPTRSASKPASGAAAGSAASRQAHGAGRGLALLAIAAVAAGAAAYWRWG